MATRVHIAVPDSVLIAPVRVYEPVRVSAGAAAAVAVRPIPKEAIRSLAAVAAGIVIRRATEASGVESAKSEAAA